MKPFVLFFIVIIMFISQCTLPWRQLSSAESDTVVLFDDAEFNRRCSLAASLLLDDCAAWHTSDSITAENPNRLDSLDNTWFVHASTKNRYVYYGRYIPETNIYNVKYAFEVAGYLSYIRRVPITIDSSILLFARAINTGTNRFQLLLDSLMLDFKFNHYIRRNNDNTFTMWFFPAGTDNFCAYGMEAVFSIDTSGSLVRSIDISGNELRYFEVQNPPIAIDLDNTFDIVPTVGNIFFVLQYGKYFSRIGIRNRYSVSTPQMSADSTAWTWSQTLTYTQP